MVSEGATVTLSTARFPGKAPSWMVFSSGTTRSVRRYSTLKMSAQLSAGWNPSGRTPELLLKSKYVSVYRSYNSGRSWTYLGRVKTSSVTGRFSYSARIRRAVKYRFRYAGTSTIKSVTKIVTVKFK